MSRWFRHYAGLCRDEKLVSVAIKSRQPVERVVWIWAAILESAAEIDDDGRYQLDPAEIAYFLRADEADISAVEAGLAASGRVADGSVVKWSNRQFRSDRSAERVAAHRERKRQGGDQRERYETAQSEPVTLQERHRNSPELETETDNQLADANCSSPQRRHDDWPEDFSGQLWSAYPRKTEKKAGIDALARLHRADRVAWADIMAGVDGLAGCDPQYVPALARWLKGERWKDERPSQRPGTGPPARESRHNQLDRAFDEVFASGPVQERPFLRLA